MIDVLNVELRDRLVAYLADEISLLEFQEWFVPRLWGVDEHADPTTQELWFEVELRLAEYTSGHRTVEELRESLLPLVRTQSMSIGAVSTRATSSSVTDWLRPALRSRSADTPLAAARG